MKSIKFNASELEFLKNHYELELVDAENYIGEIKNILKKLGVSEKNIPETTTQKPVDKQKKGKRGRPKKVIEEIIVDPAMEPEKKAKRGRKPKLEKPVLENKAEKKPFKKRGKRAATKVFKTTPNKAAMKSLVTPVVESVPII